MKIKKRKISLGFLIFIVGFLLGWISRPLPEETTISTLPSSYVGNFKVSRVIDGDTIELVGGEKVRYLGIDTPETVDPRKPVQCFGREASKKNKELVEGKTVRLEKDITERDFYSRLLRYVWVEKNFINLELVKQGFANSSTFPPDVKYQKEFLLGEKEAKESGLGLWSACK